MKISKYLLSLGLLFVASAVFPIFAHAQKDTAGYISVGQSMESDGLRVTLTDMKDSRCPAKVQCIWAGEVTAKVSLKALSTFAGMDATLTNLQPAHFGVYTVSIADALSDRILFKVEHHTGQAPPPPVLTGGTPDHPTTCIDPIDCNPPTEPAPSIWQRISTWFNTLFRKITK